MKTQSYYSRIWFSRMHLPILMLMLLLSISHSHAQSTTWIASPEDNNWSNSDNWTNGVPNSNGAIVNFGVTNIPDPNISNTPTDVGTINFLAGASQYGILVRNSSGSDTNFYVRSGVNNNSGVVQTFTIRGNPGDGVASMYFSLNANAGGSDIHYNQDTSGTMQFIDNSNAGSAVFNNLTNSSYLIFTDSSSAGTATIYNQNGGRVQFGLMTINPANAPTAAGATIHNSNGGLLFFANNATGTANTTIYNGIGGSLDVSRLTLSELTIGHLEGAGNVYLGSKQLRLGGQNTNAAISGIISDGWNPASPPPGTLGAPYTFGGIVKEGTGILTLSGANTYTGTTYIDGGTLSTNNTQALGVYDGSTVGSNAVVLRNGSTLDLQSNLTVQDFQWLNGTLQFNPTTTVFTVNDQFEYAGATTPRNFAINSAGLDLQTYTLVNFGSTNFNSGDDFTASFFNTTPNVTYTYDFLLNSNNLQIVINGAQATGPILQNSAPINIPTFADFLVDGLVNTGTNAESNIIRSLSFTNNGALNVFNNLEVTSGEITVDANSNYGIYGGTLSSPNDFQFDIDNSLTFRVTSIITGASDVNKSGTGRLLFEGNNTYTGATNVLEGTLLVNGDQTAATGDTTVSNGAVLGGSGIIGGNVILMDGSTLTPGGNILTEGAPGFGTASLRINGNLQMGNTSTALFQLDQIGVIGSGINDLVDVGGNLALNGTIKVNALAGFQEGAYRLFNYGGTLSGGIPGLDLFDVPAEYQSFVGISTAVAGQVNLIITGPDNIAQFWDGDAGIDADGLVQGGDGIWTNFSTNFTDPSGVLVETWQNGTAMFAGTAGTVTVADQIYVQGMQFMSDGYEITGGDLTSDIGIFLNPSSPSGSSTSFIVDTGVSATISASMRGSTALEKLGEGTLLLNAENAYLGGTIVSNGTLQTDHIAALGNGPVNLNGGALQPLSNLNVDSINWGPGALRVLLGPSLVNVDNDLMNSGDGGTFILDFDGVTPLQETYTLLTYGGGTNFNAADFTGISGFAIPNVAIQYAFELTPTEVITHLSAQAWGPLLQNSAPVFIPTFADFFVQQAVTTGTTTESNIIKSLHFDAGSSLQVFNNLQVTSGNFTVSGGKALIQGGTVTVPGDFNKLGAGTLDARSSFVVNGNSYIHNGALAVNGRFQTALMHVLPGGTLMGNGIVVGNVLNAGTVAPGNSIGLLTIQGNYTQTRSGTLQIEAASPTNHDVLVVTGTARLDGTLEVIKLGNGNLKYGDQLPFLRAGNIVGKFDEIIVSDPAVNRGRFINYGKIGSVLIAPASYTLVAETPNQHRVAGALDKWIGIEDGDIGAVTLSLDLLREDQYPQAFEAIMPKFHEGALSTGIELSHSQGQMLHQQLSARRLGARLHRAELSQRVESSGDLGKNPKSVKAVKNIEVPQVQAPTDDYRVSTWFQGSGLFSSGGLSLNGGEDFESGTFLAGADYVISETFTLGIFAGYGEGWGDYNSGGQINLERILFGGYATIDVGNFYLNAAIGGGSVEYDIKRPIQFATLDRTARSDPDGTEFFALLGGGYDFRKGNWTFGPQASLQYSKVALDSFTERGADSLNLRLHDPDMESLRSYLGARVAYTIQATDRVAIIPEVRAFWQHEFMDGNSFRSSLDGGAGPDFNYEPERDEKDSFIIGAGLGFQVGPRFYANLYYNVDLGREEPSHNVSISATVKF